MLLHLNLEKHCPGHPTRHGACVFASRVLHHLLTPGTGVGLPNIDSVINHFKDAFDWVELEANNSGRIIPHEGVDLEYDSACKKVKEFNKTPQGSAKITWRCIKLDVLISLAIASEYYEGPTSRPIILDSSSPDEVPCFSAKSLGHPVLRSDSLGKGTFVPNEIMIGDSGHASFILLTGPNIGGGGINSSLPSLLGCDFGPGSFQVGADVPADSFELSPVDRIFVWMGAKDHIMAGQGTFLTELSETALMLSSATRNSLVALDELGCGTSISDGQAIAESVLQHFVHKVQCRGMFSAHCHRLAVDYQNDPKVLLCHMGCRVGNGVGDVEEVTFLYRLTPSACPKSYGANVA
ncbi:hypothetical protein SO802_031560 [Lithocarpus litseifolius]|uniref:DNA mismatch repair proteins mutS family domain-containing protein n=1 Tax=Lithocarpus litseifolius TaxID=425828 RepID=A0AAW2BNX9_9ROSI